MAISPESKTEVEMYKRDFGYFLTLLLYNNGCYKSDQVEIDIDSNLNVDSLYIKGIDDATLAEVKKGITRALKDLFYNFGELAPGEMGMEPLTDQLKLTFNDYLEYLNKK